MASQLPPADPASADPASAVVASGEPSVAVLGGGISGLAAALLLSRRRPECRLKIFEAADHAGGVLRTERHGDYLVERSADMFTVQEPWAIDLCREIGFEEQLLEPSAEHRRAFVVRRGRLHPVPDGLSLMSPSRLWPLATTPLLSWRGKLRALGEYWVPPRRESSDESLADFARRRLGREAFENLIQPLIGGIYTADPERLSMLATLRPFVEMERMAGGLIRGALKRGSQRATNRAASGARYSAFRTPRDGMSSWIAALVERLPPQTLALQSPVVGLRQRDAGGWDVLRPDGTCEPFDAVIVATPAPVAAQLLAPFAPPLAEQIASIPLASCAVVVLGAAFRQIRHPLDGFGFVVPFNAGRRILAASFSSRKYPGRAPAGQVLIRTFVGGACQPELLELDDQALVRLVREELAELIGLEGEPDLCQVVRWEGTMPQYHVGHLDKIALIEEQLQELPGLELCGNAYRGVGIPFCVRDGQQAAERVLDRLAASAPASRMS